MRKIIIASLAWAALQLAGMARADVLHKTAHVGQTTVDYQVVLPKDFDPKRHYPTILAFGGGPQTMDIVDRSIEHTFRDQAEKRGYIVVMPAAPNGQLFFEEGARIFPAFLQQILATYPVEGGKFLAAGASNGGISSFYVAALYPNYFRSITAFPGFLPDATASRIRAIAGLCIHMFVGEFDELGFGEPMQENVATFQRQGLAVSYAVEKGQPHRLATLSDAGATRLFDLFDRDRQGCVKR